MRNVLTVLWTVGGHKYVLQQAVGLYLASGTSDYYLFSRWHRNKKVNKVYRYTMEFSHVTNFYRVCAEHYLLQMWGLWGSVLHWT